MEWQTQVTGPRHAGPLPGARIGSEEGRGDVPSMAVHHVGCAVHNIQKALAYYSGALG